MSTLENTLSVIHMQHLLIRYINNNNNNNNSVKLLEVLSFEWFGVNDFCVLLFFLLMLSMMTIFNLVMGQLRYLSYS